MEETQALAMLLQPHSASSEFPASAASLQSELARRWMLSSEIPWLTPRGVDRLSQDMAQIVNTLVSKASLVAQMVKNLPAMQETWVRSLGREDPLEKEMATHSSILAWGIDGKRSLVTTERLAYTHTHTHTHTHLNNYLEAAADRYMYQHQPHHNFYTSLNKSRLLVCF